MVDVIDKKPGATLAPAEPREAEMFLPVGATVRNIEINDAPQLPETQLIDWLADWAVAFKTSPVLKLSSGRYLNCFGQQFDFEGALSHLPMDDGDSFHIDGLNVWTVP